MGVGVQGPGSRVQGDAVRRRTVFIGWRGALPRLPGCAGPCIRLVPRELFTATFAGSEAVVLGADAVAGLPASLAWVALASVRWRVVLCAQVAHPYDLLRPWVVRGFGEPVRPSELPERLTRLRARRARPALEPRDWLPRVPDAGSLGSVAADAVFHLDRLTSVQDWADALDWPRDRLLCVCIREFGLSAKQTLRAFVAAAATRLRRQGATQDECAAVLGYADDRSLRAALRASASPPSAAPTRRAKRGRRDRRRSP